MIRAILVIARIILVVWWHDRSHPAGEVGDDLLALDRQVCFALAIANRAVLCVCLRRWPMVLSRMRGG